MLTLLLTILFLSSEYSWIIMRHLLLLWVCQMSDHIKNLDLVQGAVASAKKICHYFVGFSLNELRNLLQIPFILCISKKFTFLSQYFVFISSSADKSSSISNQKLRQFLFLFIYFLFIHWLYKKRLIIYHEVGQRRSCDCLTGRVNLSKYNKLNFPSIYS